MSPVNTMWWYPARKVNRILRKRHSRDTKSARILARQVARAARIPDQAPPLLHNGKARR